MAKERKKGTSKVVDDGIVAAEKEEIFLLKRLNVGRQTGILPEEIVAVSLHALGCFIFIRIFFSSFFPSPLLLK